MHCGTVYCPSKFAVKGNSHLIFNDYNIIPKNDIMLYYQYKYKLYK